MRGMIVKGNQWGNPRKQVEAIERGKDSNLEKKPFSPMFVGSNGRSFRLKAQSPGTMTGDSGITSPSQQPGSGARGTMITSTPIYYDPRFYTLDRFYYPRTKEQALSIWAMLYNRDPICGVATDMFAELPWSAFDLTGIEDKKILQFYQDMFTELNFQSHMPDMTREFLKSGMAIPHLIFNGRKGYWSNLFFHNPMFVRVTPVPIPGADPLLDMKPSPDLREFAVLRDPRAMAMKKVLPDVFIQRLMAGLPIPLDPVNCTYLARKSAPYDSEGTSIYSRIFRAQMVEDFLSNSTIAVAQRHANPLRIFKLGDRETGWLPEKEDEESLAEMLAACETDPLGAIIFHYGLEVEYVGVQERSWCHPAGTPVSLPDGTTRPIEEIKEGDVLQGNEGTVSAKRTGIFDHKGDIYRIHLVGVPEPIEITSEHEMMAVCVPDELKKRTKCSSGHHNGRGIQRINKARKEIEPKCVKPSNLSKGDYLVAPVISPKRRYNISVEKRAFAWLLGFYLAEGNIEVINKDRPSCHLGIVLSVGKKATNKDPMLLERLRTNIELIGLEPHFNKGRGDSYLVRANYPSPKAHRVSLKIIELAGKYAHKKKLNEKIFSWPKELQEELLRGYFTGDGHVSTKRNLVGVSTASPQLANQIFRILQNHKYAPCFRISRSPKKKMRHYHYGYENHLFGNDAQRFMREVLEINVPASPSTYGPENFVSHKHIGYKIREIEKIPYEGKVYSIETTGNHLYLVNGIVSHNSITKDYDWIERVKFLALGISKAFLLGETSFAAAVAGLQTMAERLLTLREKFENQWIYPKVIKNVAIMNQFYTRKTAELSHRIRTTARTEANLVMPKLKWRKTLEPSQDTELVRIWKDMKEMGITSNRTVAVGAGLDLDTERKNIKEEADYERQMKQENPELYATMMTARKKKAHVAKTNGKNRYHAPSHLLESKIWDQDGKYGTIDYEDVEPIVDLLRNGSTEDAEWKDIEPDWERVKDELEARGYDDQQVAQVEEVMREEGLTAENATQAREMSKAESQLAATALRQEPGLAGKKYLAGS